MLQSSIIAQNDNQTVTEDNLSEKIEALQERAADFEKLQAQMDSMQNAAMERQKEKMMESALEQNKKSLERFAAQKAREDAKLEKRLWIRGGLLALAIVLAIVNYIRKRKK
ncbi:MAG: hypothetical protein ACPGTP_04815 [Bacteroidia bacterium]